MIISSTINKKPGIIRLSLFSLMVIAFCFNGILECQGQKRSKKETRLTKFVDPFIGTALHGHVFLGANVPFGAVQLGPSNITQGWDWCSGYNYSDSIILGFSHTHLSGPRYHASDPRSFSEGDSHYWGTWWGGEDFEVFENKTARFITEFGMQAMPNYFSILAIKEPQDRYLFSDVLQTHQRAGNGFKKLNGYLTSYMIDSSKISRLSVEDYVYLTQCVQYYGFKNLILIQRSHEPYNMGTLLWQLNDCRPVASWNITDYYNRNPKAAWYAVKEAYRDDLRPARDSVRPKDLSLKDSKIKWEIKGDEIILKASAFAKYVFVNIEGYGGKLSDNYFDLYPNAEKRLVFNRKALGKEKAVKLKVKSFYEMSDRN